VPPNAEDSHRVRVTLTDDSQVVGDYQGREGGGVTIVIFDVGTRFYDASEFRAIEISRGTRRSGSPWLGAAIGGLAGAGIGGLLGAASNVMQEGGTGGYDTAAALGIGFAVGAVAGAIIGSGGKEEVWEEVSLQDLRLGIGSVRGGGWRFKVAVSAP